MNRIFFLILIVALSLSACGIFTPLATSAPQPSATLPPATLTCTPSPFPAATLPPAPSATATPLSIYYNQTLLSALPHDEASCMPDQTADDLGVYLYDLTRERELISINADVPFQFASAFKAPVLAYFLSQCKAYWDADSPAWQEYFLQPEPARNIPYYSGAEYRARLATQLADVRNWDNIEAFFEANRFTQNGIASAIDKRYFILSKAYAMIARSNNAASGEVLNFVYENCAPIQVPAPACYEANPISQFNLWFNQYAGISYAEGEARRGLFKWDTVIEKKSNGQSEETKLPTFGIQDSCSAATARLSCSADFGFNVWTARDFYRFYRALAFEDDLQVKNTALALLSLDLESPSRGNLKNLARRMGATAMSKNGHAYFIHGSINADAGIFLHRNTAYILVVLGYDAQPSLSLLYGDYSPTGEPLTEESLLRNLLEGYQP